MACPGGRAGDGRNGRENGMDAFRTMATVLSMVLGLGVTRLLLGLVTVFRIRRTSRPDWIVIAWTAILFLGQLEFWWALNQLPTIRQSFDFPDFLFLVGLTMMLFLAAALILPTRSEDESEGLWRYFRQDGRYGLLAYAAFLALSFIANVAFFDAPVYAAWSVLDLPLMLLPVAAFLAPTRAAHAAIIALYLPLAAVDLWVTLGM